MIEDGNFLPMFKATCLQLGVEFEADKHGKPTLACHRAMQAAICIGVLKQLAPVVADSGDDVLNAGFKYLLDTFHRNTMLAWDRESEMIETDLSQRWATWNSATKRRKFTDADYDREAAVATSKKDLARRLNVHPTNLSKYEAKRPRTKS